MIIATDLMTVEQAVEKCISLIVERERENEFRRQEAAEAEKKHRFNRAVAFCEEVAKEYGLSLDPFEIANNLISASYGKYVLQWRITPNPVENKQVLAYVYEVQDRYVYDMPLREGRWRAVRWIYGLDADITDEDTHVERMDDFNTDDFVAAITFAITGLALPKKVE